jgi:hypothetical protein
VFAFCKISTSMKEQMFNFLSNLLSNEVNIFINYFNQYFDDEAFVFGNSNVFYIGSDLSMPNSLCTFSKLNPFGCYFLISMCVT